MKKISGIIVEGEKIGLEKYAGKENKMVVNLHILSGFDSMRLNVKDNNLVKALEEKPDRQPLKIKADVFAYKEECYLQATGIVQ